MEKAVKDSQKPSCPPRPFDLHTLLEDTATTVEKHPQRILFDETPQTRRFRPLLQPAAAAPPRPAAGKGVFVPFLLHCRYHKEADRKKFKQSQKHEKTGRGTGDSRTSSLSAKISGTNLRMWIYSGFPSLSRRSSTRAADALKRIRRFPSSRYSTRCVYPLPFVRQAYFSASSS